MKMELLFDLIWHFVVKRTLVFCYTVVPNWKTYLVMSCICFNETYQPYATLFPHTDISCWLLKYVNNQWSILALFYLFPSERILASYFESSVIAKQLVPRPSHASFLLGVCDAFSQCYSAASSVSLFFFFCRKTSWYCPALDCSFL